MAGLGKSSPVFFKKDDFVHQLTRDQYKSIEGLDANSPT
jgi:hypothetical protein